jgi:hypothetical protein
MTTLLNKGERLEYLTCLKYFTTGKIIRKRPKCYAKYLELLGLPVIEVRYLAINYQIIYPKDRSIPHSILCQLLAAFIWSTKIRVWRISYCGKQIPV